MSWKPLTALAFAIGLGLHALGCNSQSNSTPAAGASASAATVAPALTAPKGPFPRGTVNPANLPDPTKVGPTLAFTAPARGAQLAANVVVVTLQAVDPDGVADVTVLGQPATAAGADTWTATVSLGPGLNVITAEARDRLGNRSTAYVSVTAGRFVQDDLVLERSLAVGMTPAGLRRVCDVGEQQAAGLQLFPLLAKHNPIVDTAALKVRIDTLTHAPLRLEAEGATSGLKVTAHLDRPVLDATVTLVGIPVARATVTAARVTAVADATVDKTIAGAAGGSAPAKRALGLRVDRIVVTFDQFDVRAASGVVDALLRPFRGTIESALRGKLEDLLVTTLTNLLGTSLLAIDRPLTINVPSLQAGAPPGQVELRFEVDQARGWAQAGAEIMGGGVTTAVVASHGPTNPTRQVLARGTRATAVVGPEPFCVTISVDAVNAMLHALWRAGGLGLKVDGTQAPAPGATMQVSAKLLYPFLPPVRDVAPDPDTPVVIEVSLEAAPVAALGTPTAPYAFSVGEAQVRLLLDYMDGQPPAELFTLRAALTLEADVAVDATSLRCTRLAATTARVDVLSEPLCDLADQELEDFVHAALPWLLDQYKVSLPGFPIPALPLGLQLQAPRTEVAPDLLTVRAGL